MGTGVEGHSLPVLLAAVLVVAAHLLDHPSWVRGSLEVLTGLLAILVAFHVVLSGSLVGFDETFVPDTGWYLTVLGGTVMILAGGIGLSGLARAAPAS